MVAKITVPSSVKRALNYNEQKVIEGKATCLLASGFLKEAKDLNFYEKLARFDGLISLNKRAKTNTLHISLNFAEGERLSEEKLKAIASLYMEKIGFTGQPFLAYEHRDAGHPHLHIVTPNIQHNGKRISLHNLGKDASEKARKELEVQFGLAKADQTKKSGLRANVQPFPAQRVIYGKGPTKRAITNVLDEVLPHYKYASLPELNAILKRYNVLADRGAEDGLIYRKGGLLYRVLDEKGNKVGVPVKASAIYNRPTLSYLEKRFNENAVQKQADKKQLQTAIDWVMIKPPATLASFEEVLQKENISLVIRQNEAGLVYGLTYIDHITKSVFNGSELGKPYSANGVMLRCGILPSWEEAKPVQLSPSLRHRGKTRTQSNNKWNKEVALSILHQLLQAEQLPMNIPLELRKRKKKRRKS
jgi:hypothetical protein